VADSDDSPDGCWTVNIDTDPCQWEYLSDSESRATTQAEPDKLADEEPEVLEGPEADASAVITAVDEAQVARIELYHSGATRHISPYKRDFTTYQELDEPLYLNAANKQRCLAVGAGSMVMRAPNGQGSSELTLDDVLHAPSVGYTLVSLGALDDLGYWMLIWGRAPRDPLPSRGAPGPRGQDHARPVSCVP
jgi:hypothetical protein